jgi:pSer/pThr/pTyr-binding forkhead associated (FHA) protein
VSLALKFISGKYQGGEYPLKMNKEIVIGRSSDLDMVLVEDMVSRKHAKIVVSAQRVTIEDLGSTNGTFVNGEKVQQSRIKEGDRILIGTSILKVVEQRDGDQMNDVEVKQRLEEAAVKAAKQSKASSMTGKIEEIPLPDLLQLFYTSKKNGVLVVTGRSQGKVYLRQGRVYYAVIDDNHQVGPQKSFNRIITWEQGDFELRPADNQEFMVELDASTEALLMEGLRLLDEFRRVAHELPGPTAALGLANPMTAPLHELAGHQLDVLQLAHNFGSVQGVLDHAEGEDVSNAEVLVDLLRRGYLKSR